MNLVVTNDDGVEAPGVWALARELSPLGQVALYAPTRNYSGAGMSITLRRELRLCPATPPPETEDIAVHPGLEAEVRLSPTAPPPRAELDIPAFALDAPPASLAVIGAAHAFGGRADALVSGINPGWNPGEEPYKVSGTVGAARVAVERGLLGVAVSTEYFGAAKQYQAIAAATRRLLAGHPGGVRDAAERAGQRQRAGWLWRRLAGAVDATEPLHALSRLHTRRL